MPKSLTETICSMPERETGEMKLRAPCSFNYASSADKVPNH